MTHNSFTFSASFSFRFSSSSLWAIHLHLDTALVAHWSGRALLNRLYNILRSIWCGRRDEGKNPPSQEVNWKKKNSFSAWQSSSKRASNTAGRIDSSKCAGIKREDWMPTYKREADGSSHKSSDFGLFDLFPRSSHAPPELLYFTVAHHRLAVRPR